MATVDIHLPLLFCMLYILSPAFAQNYQLTFSIKEESPKNTFVGNISDTHFKSDIPREEIGYVHYGFLQQNVIQTLLTLQETLGILSTAVVIDRESKNVCQSQATCSLTFDIAVRSSRPQSSYFAIISVTLIIEDINDNGPLFPQNVLSLDISESTIVETSFHINSAIDLDSGLFSVQDYEIGQQDGDFGLIAIKKLDGSFTVKLVLNSPLNREVKNKYNVVIIAMDGGNPKKFGALSVNITVTDVNDNAPRFTESAYNVTVRENATIATTILQVYAVDDDIRENGRITYRFSKTQIDARVTDLFSISSNTGEIKLKKKLVYESGTFYKIIIEASDNGAQPQVTQVIANVHVMDVGNNPPIMQINLLSSGNSRIVNLSEAATVGTFVAHINVLDKDTGKNGEVECQIFNRKFELLSMAGRGYKVVVRENLDRETKDLHKVVVVCHDKGSPSLNTSSDFMVSLADENDLPPVFTRSVFTGTIPENHPDFRTFVQIVASDEDLGKNGEVRYYIDKQSTSYNFSINELSGDVRANQMFDREVTPEVTFRVIARDGGNPSMSSMAMVKLTISDKNDNKPRILEPYKLTIAENKNSDAIVGSLKAEDDDEGDNAKLMFVIKTEYEDMVPFVVFPDGTIKTNRQLDRELHSQYDFVVIVVDQGSPRLSSAANISIFVSDLNDNPPELKFPKGKNNTVVVFNDIKLGHKVVQIEAEDKDYGVNTIASYEIKSGNEEDIFVINNKLGGLYLNRKITITKNKTFHLRIAVKDGGIPLHTTEANLNIIMTISNSSAPSLGEKDEGSNTLIVIIVVVLTLVLSVTMILIICFLRRFDHRSKARKDLEIVAPDEKYPNCYMDDATRYLDNSNSSHDHLTLSYDPLSSISTTKKKEVSFDIDEPTLNSNERELNTTMSTFSAPDIEKLPPPPSPEEAEEILQQQGRLNKLQLLQYHQAVLESQTRAWLQSQELNEESSSFDVTLPDDKYSDTSEEVTASDSGKGGSEDDIPSNHSKDPKYRNGAVNKFKTHHYVAPEFRRQGSLQRKACDLNFDDLRIHSPTSPVSDDICCRPDSRASITHSTPRPNSRAALYYTPEFSPNRTLESNGEQPGSDWDAASYV